MGDNTLLIFFYQVIGIWLHEQICNLYFLRNDDDPISMHTFNAEELESVKDKIVDVSMGIKNKNFKPEKGNHCNWCDYKDLSCPAWED